MNILGSVLAALMLLSGAAGLATSQPAPPPLLID
jgi:hypothetical protein